MMAGTASQIADIGSDQADLDPSTERYAERFSGPVGEWLLSVQTDAVRKLIAPWRGKSVLDVGGGHGQIAKPLLADGHKVTVLSSSPSAFGRAEQIDHPAFELTTGPLMNLPFPDQSFDVVTAVRMMAHVGDWEQFLAGLTRVARQAVIVDFPVPGGANALEPLLFGLKKRLEGDTRRFATMTRKQVKEAFQKNGFRHHQEINQFILPMVVHRKLKRPNVSRFVESALSSVAGNILGGSPVVFCSTRENFHG